ncbi:MULTISPECIES: acetyl-CoA carboxylase, carboxyltransferase subunit beta [Caproicibacterium]|uniref:Acetyl-coenzyme A carboxylase carboxyl transferase subunit beta n=1 Tax=Caproicibacterium lactatifermentans TaxID=2666138 RepID=A0A859DST4_9FIRM|nr:acetyl-CoA carboxylase, carboxyltransferase subunit beta [Caproicibacterium lactatifermentans]ARP50386.1 acetyl-CoA carboxylase carboxyl transferase subunit beta [Ruminococcaceae bacterium CPB6]MDD4807984.1 acetyl-CoA carboxylase, carboxyltransferase subunit beta [Oscillospiraceae bacterium]QKN23892.1 acetyl-CoA carboxylase carboxyltransferase subunit beta [Caproicibacterium lactatifermentans]QKO31038.1 acetyl-CoA carboxylase carboxyltransferase subunit beta [Caproicibacterium lactatiferment
MLKRANFKPSRNTLENFGIATAANGTPEQPQIPDRLCVKCPGCGKMLFTIDVQKNDNVCPECSYHFKMPARKRLLSLCDEQSFTEWDSTLYSKDFLSFPGYKVKLKSSRLNSRENEAVISGYGKISGSPCALFAMDGRFMMGSMGCVVGEKITRVFERATQQHLPVVGFTLSGGARMQEGTLSLMQMAKTSGAVKRHSDAGLLYITILTNPTTGGVTASFAMEGDILLAEPGALIAFAGPRVIEQTIRQKLPKGFQSAEFLLEKGFLDDIVARKDMRHTLSHLLKLHEKEA